MHLIWFLLIGLIAGWIAAHIARGRGFGLLGDLVLGVLGAMIGGFLARALGIAAHGLPGRLALAVVGAVVLLLAVRVVKTA
jgi:uncharacterized membrane protein YeaQ/YmgE (transglycosylase-associated protein family)